MFRLYRRLSSRLSACFPLSSLELSHLSNGILLVELAPMGATFVLFGGT